MDVKQKIIELIKIKGPIIPVQISKEINQDILMTSAYLSELSSQQKIKISSLKVGGTPLYYLPGQEVSLQNFSNHLHEKEKKTFDLLKQEKVLKDNKLEPVIRVALREIKDFAIPLQVTYQNNKEIFWKWYQLGKEETESLIKSLLTEKETKEVAINKEIPIKKDDKEVLIKKEIKEKTKEIIKAGKADPFFEEIKLYFNKNKINVKNINLIRKNSEIDFIIEVPSPIGNLEYYCKAKNKKRISESDLSSAYIQGQFKKLPVLFLTKGELTKRAKEISNKDFKNININQL